MSILKKSMLILSLAFTGCGRTDTSERVSKLTTVADEQGHHSLELDFRFVINQGQTMPGARLAREINTVLLSTSSLRQPEFQCHAHLSQLGETGTANLLVFAKLGCTATTPQKVSYEFLAEFIEKMSEKSGYSLDVSRIKPLPNIGVSN